MQVKKLTKTRRDGEWHCRVCVTKPGKNEECQDDSSPGYQNELEDNYVDNLDKKFQGKVNYKKNFAFEIESKQFILIDFQKKF